MMRGESAHQCTWRTLAELSDDRKIEMADKKQKGKMSVEQKKAYTVSTPDATVVLSWSVYTGRDKATAENKYLNLCQYVINRTRQQFTVRDLSCRVVSRDPVVDSITDYNEFYSILSRRAARVRCRHGVMIRQEVGLWR